jgi:hypothetical protein
VPSGRNTAVLNLRPLDHSIFVHCAPETSGKGESAGAMRIGGVRAWATLATRAAYESSRGERRAFVRTRAVGLISAAVHKSQVRALHEPRLIFHQITESLHPPAAGATVGSSARVLSRS